MEVSQSVAAAQISQVSRLKAQAGDGELSAETLEAIANGAFPPVVLEAAENNAAATEVAESSENSAPLRELVEQASVNTAPEDVIELSDDAQTVIQAVEEVTTEISAETTPTSQTITAQTNQDTASTALGNSVDIEA